MSDSKYNFLDNKVCDTISHLLSLSIRKLAELTCAPGKAIYRGENKLKIADALDNYSLRVQMTEQKKTIGQIRKRVSKKYNILATGCKDTALFLGKIPDLTYSFFLACLRRNNPGSGLYLSAFKIWA